MTWNANTKLLASDFAVGHVEMKSFKTWMSQLAIRSETEDIEYKALERMIKDATRIRRAMNRIINAPNNRGVEIARQELDLDATSLPDLTDWIAVRDQLTSIINYGENQFTEGAPTGATWRADFTEEPPVKLSADCNPIRLRAEQLAALITGGLNYTRP